MTGRLASLAAALLVGAATIIGASPAFGHASQVGSSPAADDVLPASPSEVTVTFDSGLLDMGAALVVRGQDGTSIVTGEPVIDDRSFSVAVDPSAPAGAYDVAYRVVSADGHTVEGSFTYTVEGTPDAAEPSSVAASSASPATVAGEEASETAPEAAPPVTTSDAGESGGFPVGWIVGAGLVVIVGIGAALLLRR